ncbi:helix-turn-helix domain-containing protein [Anaerotignum lactatifermentans]|nr:helix-turn-helix transcriptional regulator [Anaerotignum lactatifermentans]
MIELAEKCGIDRTVLYRIETGKLSPRLSQVEKLAAGFEVNVMELLEEVFV